MGQSLPAYESVIQELMVGGSNIGTAECCTQPPMAITNPVGFSSVWNVFPPRKKIFSNQAITDLVFANPYIYLFKISFGVLVIG